MLDLNYVRENLEKVRAGLQTRGVAPEALDEFEAADKDRREAIKASEAWNADVNKDSPQRHRGQKVAQRKLRLGRYTKFRVQPSGCCLVRRKLKLVL